MVMGRKGRSEAEVSIRRRRPFRNSTGSFWGSRGSTADLGWLRNHPSEREIRRLLGRAVYVVWSYDTPIGCVVEDDCNGELNYYFDEHHTMTTSHHQGILRVAFSDFLIVGEGPWSRTSERGRRSRISPPVLDRVRTAQLVTNHRGVQYDPRVERDTSYERDMVETGPSRAQMLDARYADPDWTPWSNGDGSNLPRGAEHRDEVRVTRENRERGWRP